MVIFNQLLTHPFAMFRSTLKNEHNCVLIKVKNSCSSPNTNALRESFEHTVDSLFIGMETAKDAIITTAKLLATSQTLVKRRVMWPITSN